MPICNNHFKTESILSVKHDDFGILRISSEQGISLNRSVHKSTKGISSN